MKIEKRWEWKWEWVKELLLLLCNIVLCKRGSVISYQKLIGLFRFEHFMEILKSLQKASYKKHVINHLPLVPPWCLRLMLVFSFCFTMFRLTAFKISYLFWNWSFDFWHFMVNQEKVQTFSDSAAQIPQPINPGSTRSRLHAP